jgi:hypothetical protein
MRPVGYEELAESLFDASRLAELAIDGQILSPPWNEANLPMREFYNVIARETLRRYDIGTTGYIYPATFTENRRADGPNVLPFRIPEKQPAPPESGSPGTATN